MQPLCIRSFRLLSLDNVVNSRRGGTTPKRKGFVIGNALGCPIHRIVPDRILTGWKRAGEKAAMCKMGLDQCTAYGGDNRGARKLQ